MSFVASGEASRGLKPWEPEELSPLHKNILSLIAAGIRPREISRYPGMPSESRISVVRNSPAGRAYLKKISEQMALSIVSDAREIIHAHSAEAARKVISIMRTAENDGVALRAAQDLLARSGLNPVERTLSAHIEVSADDVDRLVSALGEAAEPEPDLHFYEESSKIFAKDESFLDVDD